MVEGPKAPPSPAGPAAAIPAEVTARELGEPLAGVDPEVLAMTLVREQPQTVAIILATLPPEQAAGTLSRLPAALQALAIARLGDLRSLPVESAREAVAALAAEVRADEATRNSPLDGQDAARAVLAAVEPQRRSELLGRVRGADPPVAAAPGWNAFAFDEIEAIPDGPLRAGAATLDPADLAMALKGTTPRIRRRILGALEPALRGDVEACLEAMSAASAQGIEDAQARLVAAIGRATR
jgi:flagellar motor switch protein FliG